MSLATRSIAIPEGKPRRFGSEQLARVIAPLVLGILVLAIWQGLVSDPLWQALGRDEALISGFLLPAPATIFGELVSYFSPILAAAGVTGLNSLLGLVFGALFGVLLAVFASRWQVLDGMLAPIVASLAVIPIVALAPVLNSMFGASSEFSRQAIAGLASFVPIFVTTLRGFRQTRQVHRDLMRAYGANPTQVMRTVTIPTARPFIFTGIRIASSLAVISALVAEYFGGPRSGLGGFIATFAGSSTARAWAYVAASIVLGLLFYLATLALEKYATRHDALASRQS